MNIEKNCERILLIFLSGNETSSSQSVVNIPVAIYDNNKFHFQLNITAAMNYTLQYAH